LMRKDYDLIDLYWRYWPIFAGVLIGLYLLWVLFTPESFGGGFFPATLVFALRAAATYAAVKNLPSILAESQRRAWRYFSVGLWIWMVSDAVYIIAWGLHGQPWSEPSIAELLRMAGYLALVTGCASYPLAQPGRFGRIREALEVMILGISVLSLSWLIYLSPSITARSFQINALLWLSLSPIFDLTLAVLGVRLLLLRDQPHERSAFGLFSLSFIILFISDMSSSFGQVLERGSIPNMTQAGWMATATLLGLAFQRMTLSNISGRATEPSSRAARLIWRLEPLVPVAFTYSVVGYVFFDWWFSEVLDWVGLAGAGILIVLLFARQGVIGGQREMSQFAALVNSTADMAFILDEQGVVRMANPALYKALGEAVKTLDALDLAKFIEISDPRNFDILLGEARESGWSGEVMLLRPEGAKSPVLLSLNPVEPSQGGEKLLAGTAHDLTPIRQRENALREALTEVDQARSALAKLNVKLEDKVDERTKALEATVRDLERLNQELKELDQLKSEFVALVSHELRAPMTNIRSGIELLLERSPELQDAPRQSLGLVQAEVQRLSGFVETILDLSALEAGRFPIDLVPVQVRDVLHLALQRFPAGSQSRVELSLPDDLVPVQADDAGLESVFFHLLDNAFKYASEGKIALDVEAVANRVEFRVRDYGPGIPSEQRTRIFEMFHRLDSRDSREVYGYGLGLPMVQRLLTAMGGGIEVLDMGEGTEMQFWLPQAGNSPNQRGDLHPDQAASVQKLQRRRLEGKS
jgi:PAS domain S-box-containing protein